MTDTAERDQRVLQLFIAGATYQQIAAAAELPLADVHEVVVRELGATAARRSVLVSEAKSVYQERTEALFKAHWASALRGDHKSAEICRKILDQHSRLFDPHELVEHKGDVIDEIAARRSTRGAGPAPRATRAKRSS